MNDDEKRKLEALGGWIFEAPEEERELWTIFMRVAFQCAAHYHRKGDPPEIPFAKRRRRELLRIFDQVLKVLSSPLNKSNDGGSTTNGRPRNPIITELIARWRAGERTHSIGVKGKAANLDLVRRKLHGKGNENPSPDDEQEAWEQLVSSARSRNRESRSRLKPRRRRRRIRRKKI